MAKGRDVDDLDDVAEGILRCVPFSLLNLRRFLKVGARTTLARAPGLAKRDDVEILGRKVQREFRKNKNLFSVVTKCATSELDTVFWIGTLRTVVVVVQAILFEPFLDELTRRSNHLRIYTLGFAIVATSVLNVIFLARELFEVALFGWRSKTAMIWVLHEKLLKTTMGAIDKEGTSKVYTMLTSDALRFEAVIVYYGKWFSFLGTSSAFGVMVFTLGLAPALAGTGALAMLIAAQLRLSRIFYRKRRAIVACTDDRIRFTGEVLQSLTAVKTCGWEDAMLETIAKKRRIEFNAIKFTQQLRSLSMGLYYVSQILAAFAAFSTHAALRPRGFLRRSGNLTVGKTASVLALLWVARDFMYYLSNHALTIPEVVVACNRMGHFLQLPEVRKSSDDDDGKKKDHSDVLLVARDAAFAWPDTTTTTSEEEEEKAEETREKMPVVSSVNFSVRRGELVAVVGETGCGKSALLRACLDELVPVGGILTKSTKKFIAFCPQRAWNVSGSVRENILLGGGGCSVDEDAYTKALEAAALDKDCAVWPAGDATIVGEKGLTLSGGQAARLALARCVYACGTGRADLALLDDPLSAVDPKVARHLVDHCIKRSLCRDLNIGVVLATHQRQFLHLADTIVALDGDGAALPPDQVILAAGANNEKNHDDQEDEARKEVEPTTPSQQPAVEVVSKEDRVVGKVRVGTWMDFVSAGGWWFTAIVIVIFVCSEASRMTSDLTLLRWADRERERLRSDLYYRYTAFVGIVAVLGIVQRGMWFYATLRSSSALHGRAIHRVLHAPLAWIQANPFGRIINRFSADVATIDDLLSLSMCDFMICFLTTLAPFAFACLAFPPVAAAIPIIGRILWTTMRFVSKTMNESETVSAT